MATAQLTIRSTVLKMDVKVDVIIPESRRNYLDDPTDKKYPVLYVLHGGSEDNSSWLNNSILYLLARDLDLFVVMPSAYNSSWVNTSYGLQMQKYVSEELPAKMQRLFPISDKREDTFIMGESMGGYGTWVTTLTHPEKYAKAVVLSGTGYTNPLPASMGTASPIGQITGAPSLDTLFKEKYDQGVEFPEYYFMCGTEDYGLENRLKFNQFIKDNCPNIKLKEECWSGKHDFFFWNQTIPKALDFFGFKLDPEKIAHI
ncbi:MAG: hypothetical protein IJM15_06470 [Erysipelotrichaceae bacterium]|nr:hypothetical protein [Erysipelotrichaceae bacterium]